MALVESTGARPSLAPALASAPSAVTRFCAGAHGDLPEVGLVHDHEVGHLHDAGFQELERVPRSGLDHEHHGVGDVDDVGLALTDARRLHEHHVERRTEDANGGVRSPREAARLASRRQAADEHTRVLRVERHARAVAEQRPTRAQARRIDGDDADRAPASALLARDRRRERALADARRSRDPDTVPDGAVGGARQLVEQTGYLGASFGAAILDEVQRARHGDLVASADRARERAEVTHAA